MFGAFSEEYYGGGVLESWGGRVSNLMELPVCRAALQVSLEKITDVFGFKAGLKWILFSLWIRSVWDRNRLNRVS